MPEKVYCCICKHRVGNGGVFQRCGNPDSLYCWSEEVPREVNVYFNHCKHGEAYPGASYDPNPDKVRANA